MSRPAPATAPVFLFDISSPYAYLAASRVDRVLPVLPEWRPVSFGFILRETGRQPWSFAADRTTHLAEIARRAAAYGLPEPRYPEGWPAETYSLLPLRVLVLAEDQDHLRALAMAFFRKMFAEGTHLADPAHVAEALHEAGLDPDLASRTGEPAARERLRESTEDALRRGVVGVPTTIVGQSLFWGDDQLEAAAAATRSGY